MDLFFRQYTRPTLPGRQVLNGRIALALHHTWSQVPRGNWYNVSTCAQSIDQVWCCGTKSRNGALHLFLMKKRKTSAIACTVLHRLIKSKNLRAVTSGGLCRPRPRNIISRLRFQSAWCLHQNKPRDEAACWELPADDPIIYQEARIIRRSIKIQPLDASRLRPHVGGSNSPRVCHHNERRNWDSSWRKQSYSYISGIRHWKHFQTLHSPDFPMKNWIWTDLQWTTGINSSFLQAKLLIVLVPISFRLSSVDISNRVQHKTLSSHKCLKNRWLRIFIEARGPVLASHWLYVEECKECNSSGKSPASL